VSRHRRAHTAGRRGQAMAPTTRHGRGRHLWRIALVAALAAAVAIVLAFKPGRDVTAEPTAHVAPALSHASVPSGSGVPRLVDLGADRCIPCKAMAPILAELRVEYAGRMEVDFIDVWKNPAAGDPYRIYMIPTQIFFDGDGRELARHQGFISKADILATWKRLGFDFSVPGPSPPES
jgi:thioredoxin 1